MDDRLFPYVSRRFLYYRTNTRRPTLSLTASTEYPTLPNNPTPHPTPCIAECWTPVSVRHRRTPTKEKLADYPYHPVTPTPPNQPSRILPLPTSKSLPRVPHPSNVRICTTTDPLTQILMIPPPCSRDAQTRTHAARCNR
eukprot:756543-Hanusia_phi.AAC.3